MSYTQHKPAFVDHPTPLMTAVTQGSANTAIDGTGTITTVFTADATKGSLVELVSLIARGTTTNGIANLFHSDDAGVTWKYLDNIAITGTTPSATVLAAKTEFSGNMWPLRMGPSASNKLGIAFTKAENYNVFVQGGPLANSDS